MNPYKLKHIPSGLYYQPHKHRGNNVSTKGKIYQTKSHAFSSAFKDAEKYKDNPRYQTFTIQVDRNSQIYKKYKECFNWEECKWAYKQMKAETKISDWVIEEIKIENN